MKYAKTFNPCDDCLHSFTKNNQESGVCKICEFAQLQEEINRQKAEIERLKNAYKQCAWERDVILESSLLNKYPNCLFRGSDTVILTKSQGDYEKMVAEIKSEAYKECIEKVKEKSKKTEIVCSGALITTNYAISAKNLNNLLKELVGDENER